MSHTEYPATTERPWRESDFNYGALWDKHNRERTQEAITNAENAQRAAQAAGETVLPWCTACGRVLDPERASTVHIVGGGSTVLHPDDEDAYAEHSDRTADMGAWDLGPECAKMIPAAYRRPFTGVVPFGGA